MRQRATAHEDSGGRNIKKELTVELGIIAELREAVAFHAEASANQQSQKRAPGQLRAS